jgi:hypothetical protein
MINLTRRGLGGLVLALLAQSRAHATESLPLPTGKPILTISGHITQPNSGELAVLDRQTLEGLGQDGFETGTPWYSGRVRFDGVPMVKVMQAVGASGVTVRATALNDYTTDIPFSDFERFGVLLATKRDGNYMPIRDKGPLFIVYPFDRFPELQTHQYYSRAAWQVASLAIS